MFTSMIAKRNPKLVEAAVCLHQSGALAPNTHLIDLDALERNAAILAKTAEEHGMTLYYMTKQIGRSGFVGKHIEKSGIHKVVAVDIDEAIQLKDGGCAIGNLGHLVQPGKNQWPFVLTEMKPEVVTLFSLERAKQLNEAAVQAGVVQDVIIRVISKGDCVFPGQYGGFLLEELPEAIKELTAFTGIRLIGVTSFPVLAYTPGDKSYHYASNAQTIVKAVRLLQQAGVEVKHVNTPSATSVNTIPMLKQLGATHAEPGHALTGTTPLHAYREDLAELPAMVYVSEISHQDQTHAYTIAGGFYPRSNMAYAFYGDSPRTIFNKAEVDLVSPGNIDYYGALKREQGMQTGDTVVYAYRSQVFVTRSHVAFVRGVANGKPVIVHQQKRGM
ncbi:amino-acid racemase [Shouchella clausii]|uniref:YhfX family PLP-dependent enzyme n=1 Tax=Shouchella clausii TaxID=79880 RepID=UPI000BA66E48|nr:YhfX family PLP-dependent enzyme [Shouchella clausii]MBU8596179.1 YhfX family PLP-dependent enzyme [Shouchella clausii]MCM3549219.1 YhfX family PLP-dependent enzyme [Shouchella clausii]PAD09867.1 amino-acid racemase [Shouchella clausii]PAE84513.1 amino-acid racemase [Shouchella clausii]PAF06124.1 amino-acid racemase [Shouchella clausii]